MVMCFKSRSAGRLNLTKDCPHLGDNSMSLLKAWLMAVAIQLIDFLKGGGKHEESEQKRENYM